MGEGTGLGLDVVWRIVVTNHHGEIRVRSEPGDTRFEVLLPAEVTRTSPGTPHRVAIREG